MHELVLSKMRYSWNRVGQMRGRFTEGTIRELEIESGEKTEETEVIRVAHIISRFRNDELFVIMSDFYL